MKKLFATLAIVLTGLVGYSQIPKPQSLKTFSTWSITPYTAFSYENMDIENNDPFYTRTPLNIGFGLETSKQLSHFTSLQANLFSTKAEGSVYEYSFNSKLTQADIRFRFNMTNGALFRKWQSTQIYSYIGYGILWYNSEQIVGPVPGTFKGTTRIVPIGVGVKYRTGNRTSLSADLSYNHTNSDRIDTWDDGKTSKDGFTKITVGFTYNLGKKTILEWDHPWAYLVPEAVHDTTTVIQRFEYTAPAPVVPEPIKLDSAVIYYVAKQYQIEASYIANLEHVLERARDEGYSIEIMAYCDSSGTKAANYALVGLRADKVKQHALKYISEDRITIYRFDESAALYAPEARNRKVIVRLVK